MAKTSTKAKKNSEFKRVFKEFRRNKLAMLGVIIICLEILMAIFANVISPYDPLKMSLTETFQSPSAAHLFGTDDVGRDLLSRIIYGARYSLASGILSMALSVVVGVVIGSVAGYFGGQVDNIIMRILDVIQALPGMLLLIVLSAMLGGGFVNTIIAMSVGGIPGNARMIRGQMLKERGNEYIEACQSINCSKTKIIFSHLLPNCMSPIIVSASMGIGGRITLGASMSFIGLGVQPPTPEWGALLSTARAYIRQSPHMILFPGLAIAVTVLAFNLMGDGLRDALDPKLKH
jgi:peptide/nickel transport system permease protein